MLHRPGFQRSIRRSAWVLCAMGFGASLAAVEAVSGSATAPETIEQAILEIEIGNAAILAQAESHYINASALFKKSNFNEALTAVKQALTIYPAHKQAALLEVQLKGILGVREDKLKMFSEWMGALGDVEKQQAAVRMANAIDAGQKFLDKGEYNKAHAQFDAVSVWLAAYKHRFDWGDTPEQVEGKKREASAKAREADLIRQKQVLEESNLEARRKIAAEEKELSSRVNVILIRAKAAFAKAHFRRAAMDALYAYKMDPRREDARELYLQARRESHLAFDEWSRSEKPERQARINEQIHNSLLPQDEIMQYPESWEEIDRRKVTELTQRVDEAWMADMNKRLEQPLDVTFEPASLTDVVQFLRVHTGLNFVEAPDTAGLPPVNLTATKMRVSSILKHVCTQLGIKYSKKDQVIYLGMGAVGGDLMLQPYNVLDIITPVKDFPGPELGSLTSSTGGGGGAIDIFGGGGGAADAVKADPNELITLIRDTIDPEAWAEPAGIIARSGGYIYVTQTPEIHEKIKEFLKAVRAQRSVQVNVRTRLLTTSRAYIEEIGVQFQDAASSRGMLGSTTTSGFSRSDGSSSLSMNNVGGMPGNAATTMIPNNAGLVVEGAYNFNGLFHTPQINAILSAVEVENDMTVIRAPELTCYNGQRALYTFLTQHSYIQDYNVSGGVAAGGAVAVAAATMDPVINTINLGDLIDVKPLVSADRKYITMEMRPTNRTLTGTFRETISAVSVVSGVIVTADYPVEMPNVESTMLRTTVTIPDHGSMLLGGLTYGLKQQTHTGIPFLSHIPFLGRLFGQDGLYDENRRMFMLVEGTIFDIEELEKAQ